MIHFIHCSCPCFLLMWCQGFLWACHPVATAPSLIPPSSKCASQVTDGGCLYNVSYGCNFGPARISLQHTHQSTTCTSVCSLHISLQHTHQSTAQASAWSTHISLQPTQWYSDRPGGIQDRKDVTDCFYHTLYVWRIIFGALLTDIICIMTWSGHLKKERFHQIWGGPFSTNMAGNVMVVISISFGQIKLNGIDSKISVSLPHCCVMNL